MNRLYKMGRCSVCDGTGMHNTEGTVTPCVECHGTGEALVVVDAAELSALNLGALAVVEELKQNLGKWKYDKRTSFASIPLECAGLASVAEIVSFLVLPPLSDYLFCKRCASLYRKKNQRSSGQGRL